MSILDKHPAPWGIEELTVAPPIPCAITCGPPNIHPVLWIDRDRRELRFKDEESKRLILAAPELLAVVKEFVDHPCGGQSWAKAVQDGAVLIARIEGGK